MTVEISVVTPTRDRAPVLARCLDTLTGQSLDPARYEILIVDDGSTDDTPAVVEAARRGAACEVRMFRLGRHAGIPAARNRAIREAQGELIVFVDSDELAPSSFLAAHLDGHRRGGPNVICRGPVIITHALDRPFEARGGLLDLSTAYFDTDNASVRRSDLLRAGLFDESFSPYGWEGLDLGFRLRALGLRRIFRRNAALYHYHPEVSAQTLAALLAKEEDRAWTARRFLAKHRTVEARFAISFTPMHYGLNALQRGFGALHAGNVVTWMARTRRWGLPGLGRILLAGVLRERYFARLLDGETAVGTYGRQRHHPDA
ncbi:MAG TPA: glycosyltransferase [bacterium]|nr:glycosyltransferase [bacterium]